MKELHNQPFNISRDFSDHCFSQERTRFITRVTFIGALTAKRVPCNLINSLYICFDASGQEKIDWRAIVFMLNILSNPESDASDDLVDAFKFFTGRGLTDLDAPCKSRIRSAEVEYIFRYIIRPDKIGEVIDRFNSIWATYMVNSPKKSTIATKNEDLHTFYEQLTNKSLYVSLKVFSMVCKKLPTTFPGFEDHFYPPFLVKIRRSSRLMKHALETFSIKAMETALRRWKEIEFKRKTIQAHLLLILTRIKVSKLATGFCEIKRHALACIALVEIQRFWRGHQGRLKACLEANRRASIILIQSLFRGIRGRRYCKALIMKRNSAISKIQRTYRGRLGRVLASRRILTRLDQQRLKAKERRELKQLHLTTLHAINLQRKFRAKMKMKLYEQMIDRRCRELIVEQEMKERLRAIQKQKDIHEKQVLMHVEKQKNEEIQQEVIKERIKMQSRSLRIKQFIDNQTHQMELESKRRMEHERNLRHQRSEEWIRRIERQGELYKKHCIDCLVSPETKTERKFRRILKHLIKKQVQEVLKRADREFVKMELDEAHAIAEKDVIDRLTEEERDKITSAMDEDLRLLKEELFHISQKAAIDFTNKNQAKANSILCAAARRWIARKELRKLALAIYELKFDETYNAYYYRNKRTVCVFKGAVIAIWSIHFYVNCYSYGFFCLFAQGEVSWRKPKALGDCNLGRHGK